MNIRQHYGYLDEAHVNEYLYDSDDASVPSETGTEKDFHVMIDDGASPYKVLRTKSA